MKYKHYYATPEHNDPSTLVLIFPTWAGLSPLEKEMAIMISNMNFKCVAVDIYGAGNNPTSYQEKTDLMNKLVRDQNLLENRLEKLINDIIFTLKPIPQKIYSIGFCLGGKLSLIAGIHSEHITKSVSFHGLLNFKIPNKVNGQCSFMILNGYKDPFISSVDKKLATQAFDHLNVDWQFLEFGKAMHSFTDINCNNPTQGAVYDQQSKQRAMSYMKTFLME
jgi:dienelactone hydrolase